MGMTKFPYPTKSDKVAFFWKVSTESPPLFITLSKNKLNFGIVKTVTKLITAVIYLALLCRQLFSRRKTWRKSLLPHWKKPASSLCEEKRVIALNAPMAVSRMWIFCLNFTCISYERGTTSSRTCYLPVLNLWITPPYVPFPWDCRMF